MSDDSKLSPELKAQWLRALRGGRYKQARDRLRDEGAMCCLGVLCDITHPEQWESTDAGWSHRSMYRMPSTGLYAEVGICESDALSLSGMNDEGASFQVIADWIEAHL